MWSWRRSNVFKTIALPSAELKSPRPQIDPNVLRLEGKKSSALRFASTQMKSDKEVVLRAVRVHGFALRNACDREAAMAAVAHDGRALKYASKKLRRDRDLQ